MAEIHLPVLCHLFHIDGQFVLSFALRLLRPVVHRVRCPYHANHRRTELRHFDVRIDQLDLGAFGFEIRQTTYLVGCFDYLVDLVIISSIT